MLVELLTIKLLGQPIRQSSAAKISLGGGEGGGGGKLASSRQTMKSLLFLKWW